MTKDQIIDHIKSMSDEEFEDFAEDFEESLISKNYHNEFLKYLKQYEDDKSIDTLMLVAKNHLLSNGCKIKVLKKMVSGDGIWVEFDRPPPMNNGRNFDFYDYSTFVRKYN